MSNYTYESGNTHCICFNCKKHRLIDGNCSCGAPTMRVQSERNIMNEETPTFSPSYYTREQWVMLKDDIYAAQTAIKIAIDHIEDKIKEFENLSNRSRQNDKYLEILKNERLICEKALQGLQRPVEEKL